MSNRTRLRTSGGIALAALLLATAVPGAARAGEPFQCSLAEERAWQFFDGALDEAWGFAETWGSLPSISDCTRICKDISKRCKKATRGEADADKGFSDAVDDANKRLCKTSEAKKDCEQEAKAISQDSSTAAKLLKKDSKRACQSNDMGAACNALCNAQIGQFPSCEVIFLP